MHSSISLISQIGGRIGRSIIFRVSTHPAQLSVLCWNGLKKTKKGDIMLLFFFQPKIFAIKMGNSVGR